MLALANELRTRGVGLRVLNLGGDDVDTVTPPGSMLFTIMAALAQMEHEINANLSRTSSTIDAKPAKTWAADHEGSPTAESTARYASSKAATQQYKSHATSISPEPCFADDQ